MHGGIIDELYQYTREKNICGFTNLTINEIMHSALC